MNIMEKEKNVVFVAASVIYDSAVSNQIITLLTAINPFIALYFLCQHFYAIFCLARKLWKKIFYAFLYVCIPEHYFLFSYIELKVFYKI